MSNTNEKVCLVATATPLMEDLLPLIEKLVSVGGVEIITTTPEAHQQLLNVKHSHIYSPQSPQDQEVMSSKVFLVIATFPTSNRIKLPNASYIATHALIRASASNYEKIACITRSEQFNMVQFNSGSGEPFVTLEHRRQLASKAFAYCAEVDNYMAKSLAKFDTTANSPINVLILGGGGREHAIATKLVESKRVNRIYVSPGNGGTSSILQEEEEEEEEEEEGDQDNEEEETRSNSSSPANSQDRGEPSKMFSVKEMSLQDCIKFVQAKNIKLVCVGPEKYLVEGWVDSLTKIGVNCFGPSGSAARLEGSKAFSKDFMFRNGIPTAKYASFNNFEAASRYLKSTDYPIVIKASGLAAGKGVFLPDSIQQAEECLNQLMVAQIFGSAGAEVVIEERLIGEEASILAFCDGENFKVMPAAQDHKRIFDNDQGPNTGGMGAYAPAPVITKEIMEQIKTQVIQPTLDGAAREGFPFVGVLYSGIMITPLGIRVLEYNCRFGDPETQAILPLLKSDLLDIFEACIEGRILTTDVQWHEGYAATVVLASKGYPGKIETGFPISGLPTVGVELNEDEFIVDDGTEKEQTEEEVRKRTKSPTKELPHVNIFHAGTRLDKSSGAILTDGGRVLAVTARSLHLKDAVHDAYERIERIHFEGMQYRGDIAQRALKPKLRVGVLGSTRGSSLQPVIDAISKGTLENVVISIIISNEPDALILQRARENGIQGLCIPHKGKKRETFDLEVSKALDVARVDVVLLVGYMRIVTPDFVRKYYGRMFNVHPSLLPEFAGGMDLAVHEAVIKAGKSQSGCTVHLVGTEVDAGATVVQKTCVVLPDDDAESLKKRVQALEGLALIEAIQAYADGRVAEIVAANPLQRGVGGSSSSGITYADAGVDIDAGEALVERIKPMCKSTVRPGCDADLGGFGGLFDLLPAGYGNSSSSNVDGMPSPDDTILVSCTDGVGTKLKVAHICGIHHTVGIDLVAMSVNDCIVQGAEPLLFLDYFACGKLEVDVAAKVVDGIANGCRQAMCGLIGGETAEMPSMYADGEYDLAGFCVGAVKRKDILPRILSEGDVLIALPSSGPHSNGYSLVRKLVEKSGLKWTDPAPFEFTSLSDEGNKSKLVAQGYVSLGEALMEPTRIYIKTCLPAIRAGKMKALAHITGGGITDNLPRVLNDDIYAEIDLNSWRLPPVFRWLAKIGNVEEREMLRTFNCGVGMIVAINKEDIDEVIQMVKTADPRCNPFIIGSIKSSSAESKEKVQYKGHLAFDP